MISPTPAPICVSFTIGSCHTAPPVAPACFTAMERISVAPRQALTTSESTMNYVKQAAVNMTKAERALTLCGSASGSKAMRMNNIPFSTS